MWIWMNRLTFEFYNYVNPQVWGQEGFFQWFWFSVLPDLLTSFFFKPFCLRLNVHLYGKEWWWFHRNWCHRPPGSLRQRYWCCTTPQRYLQDTRPWVRLDRVKEFYIHKFILSRSCLVVMSFKQSANFFPLYQCTVAASVRQPPYWPWTETVYGPETKL